ncbi:MAG: hypothetical protein COB46_08935 [Rhodospirillaceae bacterium]|nr:MAG: hypothetical protein COB46_08935 [Rhodospirillaceae bacterium]
MNFIKNVLAVFGVVLLLIIALAGPRVWEIQSRFAEFDPKAMDTYIAMFNKILETGNAAEATVWKAKVEDGQSFEEVDVTIRMVANELNIKNVGELPLYKQVESMSGKPYRKVKIYMFCNAMTASRMLDYTDAFSAYLPCRITLIEDKQGQLWLYTLNMDPMIYGGLPLPPALKEESIGVKKIMLDVLRRGASGDF